MAGKPLEAVQEGLRAMLAALKRDPHAMETVFMSIITFDVKARVETPLTEVYKVRPPILSPRPGTAMGAALTLVHDSIEREVKKTTASVKGDYKPIIFILTDGQPTDEWKGPANLLKSVTPKVANIYAIGCGDEVDFSTMFKITENCLYLSGLSPAALSELFVWLSASVQSQSVSVSPDSPVNLEKVPLRGKLELVLPDKIPDFSNQPRLFIHCRCQKENKFYLMRYKFDPILELYMSEESVPLSPDFFSEGGEKGPSIDTSRFGDVPACPYCGVTAFTACRRCGTVFCTDDDATTAKCPKCSNYILFSNDGGGRLIVDGSQG
jgi:uncharacterized protein YegL/DNA-directed RNA polymerase subunit RPC12/RpoP